MLIAMTKAPDTSDKASEKAPKATRPAKEIRRFGGMVPLSMPVERVAKPILGKNGFMSGALVMDWPAIVGPAIASWSLPVRIAFAKGSRQDGKLVIKVAASAYGTTLQHEAPHLIAKVNTYFGYNAVGSLRIIHGPITRPKPRFPLRQKKVADKDASARVSAVIEQVDDPDLRAALERLKTTMLGKD